MRYGWRKKRVFLIGLTRDVHLGLSTQRDPRRPKYRPRWVKINHERIVCILHVRLYWDEGRLRNSVLKLRDHIHWNSDLSISFPFKSSPFYTLFWCTESFFLIYFIRSNKFPLENPSLPTNYFITLWRWDILWIPLLVIRKILELDETRVST